MRRQTAQFWATLSVFIAITLFLAGVSFAVSIPQVTEFTEVLTVGSQDFKPLSSIPDDPNSDEQVAVQATNYREKQDRWYFIATGNIIRARLVLAARKPKAQLTVDTRTIIGLTGDAAWDCVHTHEAKNWASNTGNGFYGGLQFDYGTWLGVPANVRQNYSRADLAPPEVQLAAGRYIQSKRGWSPWPLTSRMCGLR